MKFELKRRENLPVDSGIYAHCTGQGSKHFDMGLTRSVTVRSLCGPFTKMAVSQKQKAELWRKWRRPEGRHKKLQRERDL